MSIPFIIYSCSRCELRGTNLVSAGFFNYRDGDKVYSIPRACGYCRACDAVIAIETLTPRPPLEPWQDEDNTASRRWWHRLFARIFPPSYRKIEKKRLEQDNLLLEQEKRLLSRIADAGRAPVCLRCGSEDILALPEPDGFVDDGSLFPLGIRHPGCGGELLVNGSNGARLQPQILEREYDWRTGRQISGPRLEIEPTLLGGFTPPERRQKRSLDI